MVYKEKETDYSATALAERCVEFSRQAETMLSHVDNAIKSKLAKGDVLKDKSLVYLQSCQGEIKNVIVACQAAKVSLEATTTSAARVSSIASLAVS